MSRRIYAQVQRPINEEPDVYITELITTFFKDLLPENYSDLKFEKRPVADADDTQRFLLSAEVDE